MNTYWFNHQRVKKQRAVVVDVLDLPKSRRQSHWQTENSRGEKTKWHCSEFGRLWLCGVVSSSLRHGLIEEITWSSGPERYERIWQSYWNIIHPDAGSGHGLSHHPEWQAYRPPTELWHAQNTTQSQSVSYFSLCVSFREKCQGKYVVTKAAWCKQNGRYCYDHKCWESSLRKGIPAGGRTLLSDSVTQSSEEWKTNVFESHFLQSWDGRLKRAGKVGFLFPSSWRCTRLQETDLDCRPVGQAMTVSLAHIIMHAFFSRPWKKGLEGHGCPGVVSADVFLSWILLFVSTVDGDKTNDLLVEKEFLKLTNHSVGTVVPKMRIGPL